MTSVPDLMHPAIIRGDSNVSPEEFISTPIGGILQASVLATGEETINTGGDNNRLQFSRS